MPLELFIAWRYLKARRKGVFTLLTTLIAVGGITLGVASLIITLAVMSGFHRDIREKILGIQPHLIILKEQASPLNDYEVVAAKVERNQEVRATAPFVYGQVILRNRMATSGSVLKGIDLAREDRLVNLRRVLEGESGRPVTLANNEIIVGKELARNLGVRIGSDVIVMSPGMMATIPRMEKMRVSGIIHSGMYEYDASLAFVTIPAARKLTGMMSGVTGLGVSVRDWEDADAIERELQKSLSYPYWVRSWQRMNHNLFAALKLEKVMMFIILTLIILVAAFNIISNLLLMTVEKTKEIGILSAMGIPRLRIARIFFYEGLIIGISGIGLGVGLGSALCLFLKKYPIIRLPADVYYLESLPVRVIPGDIASVVLATLLITLVAGIYPAYQVTKLDPLEAIRYG